jgi:cation diffusion facilitator family transporter
MGESESVLEELIIDCNNSDSLKKRAKDKCNKELFLNAYMHDLKGYKEPLKKFYINQNEFIMSLLNSQGTQDPNDNLKTSRLAHWASFVSAFMNVILLITKIVVISVSHSLVHVVSNFTLYFAAKNSVQKEKYSYPVGKSRLEPLGIVVFSAIMGMVSTFVIGESIKSIITGYSEGSSETSIKVSVLSFGMIGAVLVVKFFLYLYCKFVIKKIKRVSGTTDISLEALCQDHLNDVITISFSIIIAVIATRFESMWVLDPIGALILSLFILVGWVYRGKDHIDLLVGKSASPEVIGSLAYIAMNHSESIVAVDTVYAYHCGIKIVVEVHIVLPEDMPLKEAHDIGDSLERKYETLPMVERAFVHMDVDFLHAPEH